jgi:hypothetical protein
MVVAVVVARHPRWQRRKSIRSPNYSPPSGDDDDNPSADDQSTCAPVWPVGTWAFTLLGSLVLSGLSNAQFFFVLLDGFVLVVYVQETQQARTPCFARFPSSHNLCTRLCSILTARVHCLYYSIFVPTPPTPIVIIFQTDGAAISCARLLPFLCRPKF